MKCHDHILRTETLPYLAWHDKSEQSAKMGQKQQRCRERMLWFFPWELGACASIAAMASRAPCGSVRRSRKEHRCDACSELIRRGDLYAYHFDVFEGRSNVVKRCMRCETMYRALLNLHTETDVTVDIELKCGHSWEDEFGDTPCPPELEALAFATPAEMQARALAELRARKDRET